MYYNKVIRKLFCGIFIIPFLISCAPKPSQRFIFVSQSRDLNGQDAYTFFVSDLYNPSKVEKLDVPVCGDPNAVHVAFPVWSPNGKYYACSAMYNLPLFIKDTNNVTTAKLEQGDPKDPVIWSFGSWFPDSQYFTISYGGSSLSMPYVELAMMKYNGTGFMQIVRDNSAVSPAYVSPNGKYLAYQSFRYLNEQMDVYFIIIDVKGNEIAQYDEKKLTNGDLSAGRFNWSPDSKKLTFLGNYNIDMNDGWYILDIESGKISSPIPTGIICGWNLPEWSPDEYKFLIVAHDCKTYQWGDYFADKVYTINRDGSNLKPLTDKSIGNAHWTPDGKSIVFDKYTDQGSEIFIMNADGANQRNLLGNRNHVSFIQWITP